MIPLAMQTLAVLASSIQASPEGSKAGRLTKFGASPQTQRNFSPQPLLLQPMIHTPSPLLRLWLFGGGVDATNQHAMANSCAQALILDLEDFTPQAARESVRQRLGEICSSWRQQGKTVAIRINALDEDGPQDLAAAMPHAPDVIAYPMASSAQAIVRLDQAMADHERALGLVVGQTSILPVCETAMGVLRLPEMAAASQRIRYALLGAEDLAANLMAERTPQGDELEHARRHFLLLCRASGVEPIDAPYTWVSEDGVGVETAHALALGYRCKSLVRPEHAAAAWATIEPTREELDHLRRVVEGFEQARAAGLDRAQVDGLWVEVPTYKAARRKLEAWVMPGNAG
jgi:citrate lyase subunit beta/citryl-CoA lyase